MPWLTLGQFDWLGWQHGNQLLQYQLVKTHSEKPKQNSANSLQHFEVCAVREIFFSFWFLLTLTASVQHFVHHRNPAFACLSLLNFLSTHQLKNYYSTFLCHNCFPRIILKLTSSLQHDLTALVHFVPLLTFVVLFPAVSLCIYRSYLHFVAVREHIILIFEFQKTSCFLSRLDPVNVLANVFVNLISQQTVYVFASGCVFLPPFHSGHNLCICAGNMISILLFPSRGQWDICCNTVSL